MRPRRWVLAAAVLAAAGTGGLGLWMRSVEDDPAEWHVPLRHIARSGQPNDFLAATPGYTDAAADAALPAPPDPAALLVRLDRAALSEPRTRRLGGGPGEGRFTWVQRSAVFGFPDYVTAEAGPEGAAVWSRSRFGRGDFGVNRARVERWLAAAE